MGSVRFMRFLKNVEWHKGFVSLPNRRELYVEYRPAKNGKPTMVFLNGLTHSVKDWDALVAKLSDPDLGIVLYDAVGQGSTLQEVQIIPMVSIPLDDQTQDLKELLGRIQIKTKVNLVGLSYGGGHSIYFANKHPEIVNKVIALAPFTESLPDQDMAIRKLIGMFRGMFPLAQIPSDVLYDWFLSYIVIHGYPLAEAAILEFPQKPYGAFQMVREMRDFVAAENVNNLPPRSLHLAVAGLDQYIPRELPNRFWDSVPVHVRGSRIDVELVEHKMNEDQPGMMARWIEWIVFESDSYPQGLHFSTNPQTKKAVAGDIVVDLNPHP